MTWKEIVVWLFIFIIGSLIVTFLVSPNSFNNFKSNVKSVIPSSNTQGVISNAQNTEDPLITSCKQAFNYCKGIYEQKYDVSISIIKAEKFDNVSEAGEFYKTWEYGTQGSLEFDEGSLENSLPIVIFATQHNSQIEGKFPFVYVCDKNGNITSHSKLFLCR